MNNIKRKILIFSTAYYPFVGGAEVAIKEITDRLGNYFEFDLITAKMNKDLPGLERLGNVNVYRLGSGRPTLDKVFLPFRGLSLIKKLSKDNDYYCMWAMMVTYSSLAAYLFNFGRKNKIPIVLTLQEGDSEEHLKFGRFGLIGFSWKFVLKNTNFLTGISNFLIDRAKKNGYKGQTFLVPNGVDLEVFSRDIDEDKIDSLKKILDKKENDIFLVTTGRLTYKNANDDVIKALTKLKPNINFIIIGKGNEGYRLQKLAEECGVEKRVKFLGFIDYKNIPEYFSVCDIFIRPSRSEGFGNSFIEAMASRLPVVGTPVGGIVDFLSDRDTGIFCSPDNPQSIVKAVNLILEDNLLRKKIVGNAYKIVFDRYGWDRVSQQMKDVFDKTS